MVARTLVALTLALLVFVPQAQAQRLALDPLNRLHAGVAVVETPHETDLGFSLGLDSRLTRIIFVDVGGWASPLSLGEGLDFEDEEDPTGSFVLRHGIYATPGLRLPHRTKGDLRWDAVLRGGFAAIWLADLHPDALRTSDTTYRMLTEPAALFGVDLQARKGPYGLRLLWRTLYCQPYVPSEYGYYLLRLDQLGLEFQMQFGGVKL